MSGYSSTPLAKKLGIGESMHVVLLSPPPGYSALLEPLPDGVIFGARVTRETVVVQVFETSQSGLHKRLTSLRKSISPATAVWVSWPKKASKVRTDITEDRIREIALPMGFVDTKVCAVTDVWSGLKLVIRKELRPVR